MPRLAHPAALPHIGAMPSPRRRNPIVRALLFGIGVLLIVVSPIIGVIPGPGGIPVFAAGLVLALRNSRWAKRAYVRAGRRWPKLRNLGDSALRRRSARRREARERDARAAAGLPPAPPDWSNIGHWPALAKRTVARAFGRRREPGERAN